MSALPPRPMRPGADRDQQVLQVINRLTFGARPGEAAQVREMASIDGSAGN